MARYVVWGLVAFAFPVVSSVAEAQVIERVSVDDAGIQSDAWSTIGVSKRVMSDDGRFVVFQSDGSNLVPDDLNGVTDVFLRDRQLGTTTRVSVSVAGGDGDGPSQNPSISADGRYVAFRSAASNLVADDTNWEWDIFRRDLQLGVTERVSVNLDGGDSNDDSNNPSISADGRHVAFVSSAWNLVPGGSNRLGNIFVRDMDQAVTELASVAWDGGDAEASCWGAAISGNGRHVAFVSTSSNIVPGDLNGVLDVFVRDLDQGVTVRASVDELGGDPNGVCRAPTLNFDGTHVTFVSSASDLVPDDTNGVQDVFVRFIGDPTFTERVNLHSDGSQAVDFSSWGASMSPGERYVAFASDASNLVDDDTNAATDLFVHDRWTGVTRRISTGPFGTQANDWSDTATFSTDERFMVIRSIASNLVDGDTNGVEDVFVVRGPDTLFVDGLETGDTSRWSWTSSGTW